MASNSVLINDVIRFSIDDVGMERLILLLRASGSLELSCPWCGLTVLPQSNAAFAGSGKCEQKVSCVGCGRTVNVRMYTNYGFVMPENL